MSLSEEIRRKLIATFQTEQREHLQTMTQGLLRLEKAPDPSQQQATLDEIFVTVVRGDNNHEGA